MEFIKTNEFRLVQDRELKSTLLSSKQQKRVEKVRIVCCKFSSEIETLTCGLSDGAIVQFSPKKFNKKVLPLPHRNWHRVGSTRWESSVTMQAFTREKWSAFSMRGSSIKSSWSLAQLTAPSRSGTSTQNPKTSFKPSPDTQAPFFASHIPARPTLSSAAALIRLFAYGSMCVIS